MATTPSFPFTYVLVGAGRVGPAVAKILRDKGNQPVGVASRTRANAESAATLLGTVVSDIEHIPPADVVLLAVGDEAIPELAARLTPQVGAVIHFAGAYGIAPLQPVIERGVWGCALHPVQACPDVVTAVARLPGSAWGVTCTWPAREWAHRFVAEQMEGHPVDVEEALRPIWHAAAVSTSNGIAALMAVGERLMGSIGVAEPATVLGPLAWGTVQNAITGGGGAATLTGPAIRGDTATIERHIEAIRARSPELLDAYVAAAEVILEAGNLDDATSGSIRSLLDATR